MSDPLAAQGSPNQVCVWVGGEETLQITVLQGETLYLADVKKGKALKSALEALQTGALPTEALGSKVKPIPVADISEINTAGHLSAVKFAYNADGKIKREQILVEDGEQRLDAFETMHAAMGPDTHRINQTLPVKQAIIGPSIGLLVTIAGTAVMFLAASDMEAGEEYKATGRRRGLKVLMHSILEKLGPTGVLVVGGLVFAGLAFWLYRRISRPPEQLIVQRTNT